MVTQTSVQLPALQTDDIANNHDIVEARSRAEETLLRSLLVNCDVQHCLDEASASNTHSRSDGKQSQRKRASPNSTSVCDERTVVRRRSSRQTEFLSQHLHDLRARLIRASESEDPEQVLDVLSQLEAWPMTLHMLRVSAIGREVNHASLRKSACQEVARRSRALVACWRRLCKPQSPQEPDLTSQFAPGADRHFAATGRAAALSRELESTIWTAASSNSKKLANSNVCPKLVRREYLLKVRSIIAALRRPECAVLRARLFDGSLEPAQLVCMPPEEFISRERRAAREHERQELLRASIIVGSMFTCYSKDLECPSCGAQGARYATPGSEE